MKQEISSKQFFINYGFLVAIILVLLGILIFPVINSQKVWNKNLKFVIEKVFEQKEHNVWQIESLIKIDNPFSQNMACYSVRNRQDGKLYKAILIRIQTYYGAIPCVFLIDEEKNVSFIGFSSMKGRIGNQLLNNKTNSRIEYWKNAIKEILD